MANRKAELEDHIKVLEDFETKYGAFLLERRARAEEERRWHGEEWAERQRELKELAPQAEAAMVAAGARRWDGGPVKLDLPNRILNFVDRGNGVDDDEEQWKILDELPTHIGALKGKLRRVEPEPAKPEEVKPGNGDGSQWWRLPRWIPPVVRWVIYVAGAVIAGLLVLVIWNA